MDFFSQLAALGVTGNFTMVASGTLDKMVVSVLVNNEQCGDKARHLIKPLILKGSAAELDAGFFSTITAPVQAVSGLQVNMQAHLKSVDEAKKAAELNKPAAAAKPATTPAASTAAAPKPVPAPVDPKVKAFEDAMKKVDELETAKKHKEALAKLPSEKDYPAQAARIKATRQRLVDSISGVGAPGSIFDMIPAAGEPAYNPATDKAEVATQDDEGAQEPEADQLTDDDLRTDDDDDQGDDDADEQARREADEAINE